MDKEEVKGEFHRIKMDSNALAITQLMYADDLLVMSQVSEKDAKSFKRNIKRYYSWSG